jgi:hypothetical protein
MTAADYDNGTGGSFFGINPYITFTAPDGVGNANNVTGGEINVGLLSPGKSNIKTGLAIVGLDVSLNDTQGTFIDAGLIFYGDGAGNAGAWRNGILFGDLGDFPVSTDGNIIRAGAGIVTNGIDFSDTTFLAYAFRSPAFDVSESGTHWLELKNASAGSVGPTLFISQYSASPANNDDVGKISFFGNTTTSNTEYGNIYGTIGDVTHATRTGVLGLYPIIAGVETFGLGVSNGVKVGAATGNYQGTGTINISANYYVAGTKVVGARDTGWTAMTGTPDESTSYATGTITLPQLAGRVMALQTALTTHGLIGT